MPEKPLEEEAGGTRLSLNANRLSFQCFGVAVPTQGTIILYGKGEKSRIVPIPEFLKTELMDYQKWSNSSYILDNNRGPLNPNAEKSYLNRIFIQVRKRLSLPEHSQGIHVFRHSFLTSLAEAGTNIETMRKLSRCKGIGIALW